MPYFRILTDDVRFADRWFLDEPLTKDGQEIDAREFTNGRPYIGAVPVSVPIHTHGKRVKFCLAAFDMPVVSEEIVRIVTEIAGSDVECFPVAVGTTVSGYAILNVVALGACVDERRSDILRWQLDDDEPDKVGKYRMVSNLTIDPRRTDDRHIFRVDDWEVALIISEKVKASLEKIPDLGVIFQPVC